MGLRPDVDLEDLTGGFIDISVREPRTDPAQWSAASQEDPASAQVK